jgi:uncharacterized protein YegJ (DUF2314 family)
MSFARFPYPGSERAWTAGPAFLIGVGLLAVGIKDWASLSTTETLVCFGIGSPILLLGAALWCDQLWARIPAVVLFGILGSYFIGLAVTRGGSWSVIAGIVSSLWMMWDIWREFSPRSYDAETAAAQAVGEARPLISLVLLLRRPRHLDARILARYCEAAWGGPFTAIDGEMSSMPDGPTGGCVAGKPPLLIVAFGNRLHLVHNHDQPYFDDPTALANASGDLRIRQLLAENRGWMAVDLICNPKETVEPGDHYPRLALLIAELAGPDCQAIYQPAEGRFNHWDDSLESKLREGDLSAVFSEPMRLPVVEVPDEDPRMQAAADQARARWFEFETAFLSQSGSQFSVKAPITAGDRTEFIWVEVDAIEDALIRGRLANDPVDLDPLNLGDPVTVPRDEIADWVFFREGSPIGLFSLNALTEIQRNRSQSD